MASGIITEQVWQAHINYIDQTHQDIIIKNPYNKFQTRTGLLQAGIFTMKEAHYAAFAQSGFGVKNILLSKVTIEYRIKDKAIRVLSDKELRDRNERARHI